MLGLNSDWEVSEVDLQIESNQIQLKLTHCNNTACCVECGEQSKVYDYSPERTWRHLNTMQFTTVITAQPPRISCSKCGNIKSAKLPWADKHSRFTLMFEAFAIEVLQSTKTITDARSLLGLSWNQTHSIMKRAVERGLLRRDTEDVDWLGMDEKSFRKGHNYISVLNDLEQGRVIDVEEGRCSKTAEELIIKSLNEQQREMVCGVSIDMSAPYKKAIREHLPHADIVHDKFHIAQHLNQAVDLTRRKENKELIKDGDESLKGTKYQWLRKEIGLSEEELQSIATASERELKTSKAYYLKELFNRFWSSSDKGAAHRFFRYWETEVKEKGIKAMIDVAAMLDRHMDNILTYFDCYITNAVSEGLNSKIQSLKSSARGFRSFENYRVRILFFCGKLKLAP